MKGIDSLDYEGLLLFSVFQPYIIDIKPKPENQVKDLGHEKYLQKENKKVHLKVLQKQQD